MPTKLNASQVKLATSGGLEDQNGELKVGGNFADSLTMDSGSGITFSIGATLDIADITGTTATGVPISSDNLVNKSYVDEQVVGGTVWREVVLSSNQLNSPGDFLAQATVYYLVNQPTSGDLLSITDGSITRTYGFGSGGDVTVTIGANADDTMSNLASEISADSFGNHTAFVLTDLQSVNPGGGSSTAGTVVLIQRTVQLASSYDDRMYAVVSVASDHQYVNYAGELDYSNATSSDVPGADPGVKEFGFGRISSELLNAETHLTLDDSSMYSWDGDAGVWNQSGGGGGGSVTGGDGIDVTASVVSVDLAANSGLNFSSAQLQIPSSSGAPPVSAGVQNVSGNLVVNMGNGMESVGNFITAKADTVGTGTVLPALSVDSNGIGLQTDGDTLVGIPFSQGVQTRTGRLYRESVLIQEQLDFTGVRQAIAFWLSAQPTALDSFSITDGTTTRTYGFDTVIDGIITIGANADETMDNMATTISSDFGGGLWDAVTVENAVFINPGPTTKVLVIYRRQQFISSYDDRIYGSGNYITSNFGNELQFTGGGIEEVDYSFGFPAFTQPFDPGLKTFGFGREAAILVPGSVYLSILNYGFSMWDAGNAFFVPLDGNNLPLGIGLTGGLGFPIEISLVPLEVPAGAIDGANTTFTLSNVPAIFPNGKPGLWLYKNGILQIDGGADYSLAADTITFSIAPTGGDTLIAYFFT